MMGWLGIVLLLIGVSLFFVRRRQVQRSFSLKAARRTTVEELESTAAAIAAEIGGGDWRDYVKLWGMIEAEQPLISELKQQPCVVYTMTVEREYEETVVEKDSAGKTTTETRRGSETLSSHRQSIPFYLTDNTGQILVDPDGADLELVEVLNQFQPGEPAGGLLSLGQFSLTLGSPQGTGRRTLGYRYRESVLPMHRSALVVGTVSDRNGPLTLVKPAKADYHYIIALKSDDVLTADADKSTKFLLVTMIGFLVAGAICLVIGLV